ncbi:MAG: TRAP transporter small permease [Bacteroidetes bacterium]|nr:TRAP transporter small permease [Bacteroidota bacterium]
MKNTIDRYLGYFLAFLMMLMTADVLWGVFTRYALESQASWSEELARFLLIWIGILGAAYASGQNMHLAIDLLLPKLKGDSRKRLFYLINMVVILFALAVMVIGGLRLIYITYVLGQLSPALRIPMTLVYGIVPISGLLVIYYKLHSIRAVAKMDLLNVQGEENTPA